MGCGAIARYLHAVDNDVTGDAVDIDADIIKIAKQYFDFPTHAFNTHIADIRQWQGGKYDLVVVDIAENELTPDWLMQTNMIEQLKKQLTENGVLVFNVLINEASLFGAALAHIRQSFYGKTMCVSVPDHKNIVVVAFNAAPEYSVQDAQKRCMQLGSQYNLDFCALLQRMCQENPAGSGVF